MGKSTTADDQKPPTLLAKWQTLMHATTDSRLSRNDLCVLAQLLDYANAETWLAWPSRDTLHTNLGTSTPRNLIENIKQLMKYGYLELVMRGGGRSQTTRYRPVEHQYTRPAETMKASSGLQNSVPENTVSQHTVSINSVVETPKQCGADAKTVCSSTPELVYELGRSPNEVNNFEVAPDALAPDGAALGAQKKKEDTSGLVHPWFWEAWGSRRNVFTTEQAIGSALHAGVSETALLDGVKRYGAYCQSNGKSKLIPPLKWIQQKRWLDSWQAPGALPPAEVTQEVEENDDDIVVHGELAISDAWQRWEAAGQREFMRLEKKHGDCDASGFDDDMHTWEDRHPEPAKFADGLKRSKPTGDRADYEQSTDQATGKPICRVVNGGLMPELVWHAESLVQQTADAVIGQLNAAA